MIIKTRNRILKSLSAFRKDNKGIAAIEFAYIAPILIVLWLGTIELSVGVTIDRKVSRVASTVADLITQVENEISEADIEDIMKAAEGIMFPYDDIADPQILVNGLEIEDDEAKVVWSRTNGGPRSVVGSVFPIPDRIIRDGAFLIVADVTVEHTPLVGIFTITGLTTISKDTSSFTLNERLYLRPRRSNQIEIID